MWPKPILKASSKRCSRVSRMSSRNDGPTLEFSKEIKNVKEFVNDKKIISNYQDPMPKLTNSKDLNNKVSPFYNLIPEIQQLNNKESEGIL